MKLIAVISAASAMLGAGTTVDENTLVPLGLFVAAIIGTATLAWKLATWFVAFRRDIADLNQRVKRLEGTDSDPHPNPLPKREREPE